MTSTMQMCFWGVWLLLEMCNVQPSLTQLSNITALSTAVIVNKVQSTGRYRGIETEVFGPLRIWHLVAISGVIVTTAVVIVCCCWNFRVPRTRQQIEENYKKRLMNTTFLRKSEQSPRELLERHQVIPGRNGLAFTESSRHLRHSKQPVLLPRLKIGHRMSQTEIQKDHPAVTNEHVLHQRARESNSYSPIARPCSTVGVQTPLAFHPRDILSLMPQQTN